MTDDIPGPPARWLGRWSIGRALAHDPLGTLERMHQEYGRVVRLGNHTRPIVLLSGADMNRELFAAPGVYHPALVPVARSPGAPVDTRSAFATVRPATAEQLDVWHSTAVALAEDLVGRWSIGRELDAEYTMTRLLFRVVCRVLFGPVSHESLAELERCWLHWSQARTLAALQVVPQPAPGPAVRRLRRRSARLIEAIRHLLLKLRADRSADAGLLDGDVLAGQTDDQLLAEIVVLMVIGHACGSALAWTLYLLSQHPLMLTSLHDQLRAALHGGPPSLDQLNELSLLHAVVEESLRLLPPFSVEHCLTTEPVELGGFVVAPGTAIQYSPYVTHRAPELYLWPYVFRPERWRSISPEPHQFMPFGAHPDVAACEPLARILIRLVLAIVIQHASLGLSPGVRIDLQMRLTLVSAAGLPMMIAPADRPVTRRAPEGNIRTAVHVP